MKPPTDTLFGKPSKRERKALKRCRKDREKLTSLLSRITELEDNRGILDTLVAHLKNIYHAQDKAAEKLDTIIAALASRP